MGLLRRRSQPADPTPKRVLVTGAAGCVGRAVCGALHDRGHHVTGLDRSVQPADLPADRWVTGDITDHATLEAATAGAQTLVHLAAALEDRPFDPDQIEANIRGLHRVYAAAVAHGVGRVVLAGSVNTFFWHTLDATAAVGGDATPAPLNLYAATKAFAEGVAVHHAWEHGLPTVVLRLGWLPRDAASAAKIVASRDYHGWFLSRGDAGRAFASAVEADAKRVGRHAVVFITSRPAGRPPFDLRPARRTLGYVPRDRFDPASPMA